MGRRILFVGLLLLMLIPAAGATLTPYYEENPSYDGMITGPAAYTKTTGGTTITISEFNTKRGFFEWIISSIPDNATLLAARVTFTYTGGTIRNIQIREMVNQPSLTVGAALYNDIADGDIYDTYAYVNEAGWAVHTYTLSAAGLTDLDASLALDWFAVGLYDATGGSATDTFFATVEDAAVRRPILEVDYYYTGVYYTFTGKLEDNTATNVNVVVLDSDGSSSSFTVSAGTPVTYGFTERPAYVTWNITTGYYRRIYMTADTGNITVTVPESTFAVFTPLIRDFAYATAGGAYLESYRTIGGASTLIERVPLTNLINGIPIILTVNRVYTLLVNTPTTDFSFSFYSTTATASPVLVLTPPTYSDVVQFNTRYIHANLTRPTPTSITLEYLDDLANTTLTVFNIRTRAGALIATWNTTSDNFSHTHMGLTNTTDYIAEALIQHGEYGSLTYRRVFAGAIAANTPPDLSGLGSFGAIDMTQIIGGGIIVLTASMFGAVNVGGGLIVTALVAATLGYYGWITINTGVIVFVIAIAVFYIWGRTRN